VQRRHVIPSKKTTIPKKLKTTGRALPVVLEVYHKGRSRLLETELPSNDLIGYLGITIHDLFRLVNKVFK
jgi:hypothetical protein